MAPTFPDRPLLVLIAGPYLSGTDGDPARIEANLRRLEALSWPIYQRGHLPMVGEWIAWPVVRGAGGCSHDDEVFQRLQYPVARRLIERCDAVLRLPGASRGADQDVELARALGLPVVHDVGELPDRSQAVEGVA